MISSAFCLTNGSNSLLVPVKLSESPLLPVRVPVRMFGPLQSPVGSPSGVVMVAFTLPP